MSLLNLFLFALGQVFLSPCKIVGRRCLAVVVVLSLLAARRQNVSPRSMPETERRYSSSISEAALSPLLVTFPRCIASLKPRLAWITHTASWWRGDLALAPLLDPHRKALRVYLLLMALDSFMVLGVPYVGQKFFETAADGAGLAGSFGKMLYISVLLIGIEGLDPLRQYVQFLLTRLERRYVAQVRLHLLNGNGFWNVVQANLIYFHAPSFATRNIEVPLKLPLMLVHGMVCGWLLWRIDPTVTRVAVLTAIGLGYWSLRWSQPLAEANARVRQAESEAVAALEHLTHLPPEQALLEAQKHFQNVQEMEVRQSAQSLWFNGVIDRVGTVILMKGVLLWSGWYQYLTGHLSTAEILTVLALAWNVQFKITSVFALVKSRLEAESASFLLERAA